jgi:hypothetical protein
LKFGFSTVNQKQEFRRWNLERRIRRRKMERRIRSRQLARSKEEYWGHCQFPLIGTPSTQKEIPDSYSNSRTDNRRFE